ncbi:MAG: hypothetical protein SGI92_09225 [Bryobacteraceae bacterium]|nr:hypothetical protein [Bryobacteraceae bacterium]
MALFTDGNIANLNDLRAYESSILDLAGTEGIDLGAKLSLAHRELEFEIVSFLLRRGQLSGAHRELDHVVVTDPMLHAHTMLALALIYRDAYNSQLNDRYEGKWKQYSELSRNAVRQLFEIGVGITYTPLPRPQPPVPELLLGGFRQATTYAVRVALTGTAGYMGALSDASIIPATPGVTLQITLGDASAGTTGWVLFVSDGDGPLQRQNEQPLAPGTVWTCPSDGIRMDLADLVGQGPDYYVVNRKELLRG